MLENHARTIGQKVRQITVDNLYQLRLQSKFSLEFFAVAAAPVGDKYTHTLVTAAPYAHGDRDICQISQEFSILDDFPAPYQIFFFTFS